MKRISAIVISILMCTGLLAGALLMTGCQKAIDTEKVYAESIPLGGKAGVYPLEGDAFGEYKEISPEDFGTVFEDCETHVYQDLNCNTPNIVVYRWKKNGMTLDEMAKVEAESVGAARYKTIDTSNDDSTPFDALAYISSWDVKEDGQFYYLDMNLFEDGDDFVELVFGKKTEEVQIGTTDKYVWLPSGYTDLLDEDERSHGAFFYGEYSEDYYLPVIWGGKTDGSYEYAQWFHEDEYPDGLPMSGEEFWANDAKLREAETEEEMTAAMAEYYEMFGYEMMDSVITEKDDVSVEFYRVMSEEKNLVTVNIHLDFDLQHFEFCLETPIGEDAPYIGQGLIESIHTKEDSEAEGKFSEFIPLSDTEEMYFYLDGKTYGTYEEIPAEGVFAPTTSYESHLYYDGDADTPYIATYRYKKNGMTLEEAIQEEAAYYPEGYYRIVEASEELEMNATAFICDSYVIDGEFYYVEDMISDEGDDFLEIIFVIKTQEVPLGDSGKSIYLPTGQNNYLNREEVANGAIFRGSYDECYYFPSVWLGKIKTGYEFQEWFWHDEYPEGLPFTEEELDSWYNEDGFSTAYYDALGYEVTYERVEEIDGVQCSMFALENEKYGTTDDDVLFEIGDDCYELWSTFENVPYAPFFGLAIMKSIH